MSSVEPASRKVFLLHGWGGSMDHSWRRTGWVSRLEALGWDVHGLELLGHGVASGPHDPEAYANVGDLVEQAMGAETGIIGIGYSLGAKMLLEMACRDPRRFSKLVLLAIGENAFRPLGASHALADAMRNGLPDEAPAGLKRLIASVRDTGNDPLAMAACIIRPQERPITPQRLEGVRTPILVVNGSEDHFVLPQEPLVDVLPNASSVLLNGLDHLDMIEDPAVFASIADFIGHAPEIEGNFHAG